ncbi:DUF4943 family protein [Bacteroides sp.]
MKKTFLMLCAVMLMLTVCVGCSDETLDYNNPDVDLFVKQLKSGNYTTRSPKGFVEVPNFTEKDIPALLKYAEDMTIIPSFPLPPVSACFSGKVRLGESILWIVETIRVGNYASLGCKMVRANAENYEGIYFLTDEEVLDAAARYRHWWESRQFPRTVWTIDACFNEPLCGSGYRWW